MAEDQLFAPRMSTVLVVCKFFVAFSRSRGWLQLVVPIDRVNLASCTAFREVMSAFFRSER